MGMGEIRALLAKRTGIIPDSESHAEVKPSGAKEKKPLRRKSLKRQAEDRAVRKAGGDPFEKELEAWFTAIAKDQQPGECKCWECNSFIPDKFIRHATAHIFPKKDFPSVATHPMNFLILGAGCCHGRTHRIDTFSKMAIWREAVDRFFEFEPQLTAKDRTRKYYILFVTAARRSFPQLFEIRPDLCLS